MLATMNAAADKLPKAHPLVAWAVAVGYLFLPVDVLPEVLLGPLGVPDDLFMLFWAWRNTTRPAARATEPLRVPPDRAHELARQAVAEHAPGLTPDEGARLYYEVRSKIEAGR